MSVALVVSRCRGDFQYYTQGRVGAVTEELALISQPTTDELRDRPEGECGCSTSARLRRKGIEVAADPLATANEVAKRGRTCRCPLLCVDHWLQAERDRPCVADVPSSTSICGPARFLVAVRASSSEELGRSVPAVVRGGADDSSDSTLCGVNTPDTFERQEARAINYTVVRFRPHPGSRGTCGVPRRHVVRDTNAACFQWLKTRTEDETGRPIRGVLLEAQMADVT